MSPFELEVKNAAEKAVLKLIADGSWLAPDYSNRFKVPPEMLSEIWQMVDREQLKLRMAARLECELADRIMNQMAAEIATDVKQILSVKERREALRNVVRDHMTEIMTAGEP